MADIDSIWEGWHAEELIGRGAYGKVYRMSRSELGHTSYAAAKLIEIPQEPSEVKSLLDMGMDNLSIKSYFEATARHIVNEIAVMESLKGARNIVVIDDYKLIEHEDGIGWTICIRMELLQALHDYQRQVGPPDADETVRIGVDVCSALACCEERGVIHRDVKPENVFRSAFGDYKLGDFGISRQIENSTRSAYSQKGTGPYMAPEVVRGERYDSSVDVYSLGIMLYRYLNGMRFPFLPPAPKPFTAEDAENAQLRRLRGDELPPPVGADPALAQIVLRACQADPSRRYRSARELRDDLVALGGDRGRASSDGPATPDAGRCRGRQGSEEQSGFEQPGHQREIEVNLRQLEERARERCSDDIPTVLAPPKDDRSSEANDGCDRNEAVDGEKQQSNQASRRKRRLLLLIIGSCAIALSVVFAIYFFAGRGGGEIVECSPTSERQYMSVFYSVPESWIMFEDEDDSMDEHHCAYASDADATVGYEITFRKLKTWGLDKLNQKRETGNTLANEKDIQSIDTHFNAAYKSQPGFVEQLTRSRLEASGSPAIQYEFIMKGDGDERRRYLYRGLATSKGFVDIVVWCPVDMLDNNWENLVGLVDMVYVSDESSESGSSSSESATSEDTESSSSTAVVNAPPRFSNVNASSVCKSDGIDNYNGESAIDGDIHTAWVTNGEDAGDASGQWIELSASSEQRVSEIRIMPGFCKSEEVYAKNRRPHDITLKFSDGSSVDFELTDSFNVYQTISLDKPRDTRYIRIVINSSYDSDYDGKKYDDCGISEIEIY